MSESIWNNWQAEQSDEQERMRATPKVVIMGSACVIISSLTPEDVDRYKNYHPEALTMVDEDDAEVFALDIDNGPGRLSNEKAVLSRAKSSDGKATITILLNPEEEDKVTLVQKRLGAALLRLEDMEKCLIEKNGKLKSSEEQVKAMLTQI